MLGSGGTKEGLLGVGYLQHDQLASVRTCVRIIAIHKVYDITEKQTGIRIYKHCTYSLISIEVHISIIIFREKALTSTLPSDLLQMPRRVTLVRDNEKSWSN